MQIDYVSTHFPFSHIHTDAFISRVGEEFSQYLQITQAMLQKFKKNTNVTYVLTEYTIQEEGYLTGIEFVVAQPGPIRIQVGTDTFRW